MMLKKTSAAVEGIGQGDRMTDKSDRKPGRWLIAIVLLCMAIAATWYSLSLTRSTTVNLSPEDAEIVDIAKKAVGDRRDWTFEKPQKNSDGSWTVFAQSIPPMPGGHCMIIINNERKVTNIIPGA